jgi:toxin YoeB
LIVRRIRFVPDAWDAYRPYQQQDRRTLKRINALITDAAREPFAGIGKPEPLRGNLSGYWSRRIDDTHRLVYRATDTELVIIACRFHYDG